MDVDLAEPPHNVRRVEKVEHTKYDLFCSNDTKSVARVLREQMKLETLRLCSGPL